MISGIGIDILSLPRFQALISRRGALALAKRICTPSELGAFRAIGGGGGGGGQTQTEIDAQKQKQEQIRFLSSRWALKEAAYKALSPSFPSVPSLPPHAHAHAQRKITWKSLHVEHTPSGQPTITIQPLPSSAFSSPSSSLEATATASSSNTPSHTHTHTLMASLTHDAGVVVAVVIAFPPLSSSQSSECLSTPTTSPNESA